MTVRMYDIISLYEIKRAALSLFHRLQAVKLSDRRTLCEFRRDEY